MSSYLTPDEEVLLNQLLDKALPDSLRFWEITRINGASASMASGGNENLKLIEAFDKIRKLSQGS